MSEEKQKKRSESDFLTYRELSFWDRVQQDYDLYIALFGKPTADEWLRKQRPLHIALEDLWRAKGFRCYGDYEDWETSHIEDRNAYLKERGVWDLWQG